jgi:hypothetical protein
VPKILGRIRSFAMPYNNLLAISMLISAELMTANTPIHSKIHRGKPGAPTSITLSSAPDWAAWRSLAEISSEDVMATST